MFKLLVQIWVKCSNVDYVSTLFNILLTRILEYQISDKLNQASIVGEMEYFSDTLMENGQSHFNINKRLADKKEIMIVYLHGYK